jgi:hypothetical protein
MNHKLVNLLRQFVIQERIVSIAPYGEGHIHDTFLVETSSHIPDYILQKINRNVFRNIPGMMNNIEMVTGHIRRKLAQLPGHDPDMESLTLVYTQTGLSYHKDDNNDFWRMYVFIPDTITYQEMTDPALAHEAGKAIGFFQALLTDLNASLIETIPDFHTIDWRIRQYQQAKLENPAGRASVVKDDLLFAEQRFDCMSAYYHLLKEKAVIRATHNDTKLNNILFEPDGKALCLIDLDTVMPGYVHFDYGDALRTMSNTAPEDEKDLSKVKFNREIYQSFTRGYLEEAERFLTSEELTLLPYAPIYLTFIIGLRFLTDFLNGDIYYRTLHPEHNLDRARVQFKLVEEMEKVLIFNL